MQDSTLNTLLACGYLLLWIITFICYHLKHHSIDAGSGIIFMYILYAIISIDTLNDSIFSTSYENLKVFPYIYLYCMMIVAMLPIIRNHCNPPLRIAPPHTRILQYIAFLIVVCGLAQIPNIISNFGSGFIKLFTDADAGRDAYMEGAKGSEDVGAAISNLPAVVFNAFSDIAIFLAMYYATLSSKKVWCTLLWITVGISLLIPVFSGQRTGVITGALTIFGAYLLFKKYLGKKTNFIFQRIAIIAAIIILLPVGAITISRFGNGKNGAVTSFLNWYIGQGSLYFNNYGLNAGGTRKGERTANLFLRVINPETSINYVERRDKFHNMEIDDHLFTTFVGDFTLDYGPIIAVFIFIIFYGWVFNKVKIEDESIKLHQLLLLFITMCISMQGGMYLFNYADTGNLKIITFGLLYGYLRYHEILLKKYPLK